MPRKATPLAFGSAVPRFGNITLHPRLDPQGQHRQRPLGCDPARYTPQPMHLAYKKIKKVLKDPWKYQVELKDWAQNLGYRNQKILEQRKWQASLLGPCWTEIPEDKKCEHSVRKNTGFGTVKRFESRRIVSYPGPGTYYSAVPYKVPYGPHSTRPTFEREEPCRFPDRVSRWSLAPNRYNVMEYDNSIENKSKKIVSVRGPYDLFTGKRDGSTIKNHFSDAGKVHSTSWPLMLPGSLEGLKRKRTGVWNKSGREHPPRHRTAAASLAVIRKPTDPGPGDHDVRKEHQFVTNKYPFNLSDQTPPNYIPQIVWPGVGRYSIANERRCGIIGQGHPHVFLSKVPRTIGAYLKPPMNTF